MYVDAGISMTFFVMDMTFFDDIYAQEIEYLAIACRYVI